MKKTINQLRASKRNLSLGQVQGMIIRLNLIYDRTTDPTVQMRINSIVSSLGRLIENIKDTNYESWKA